MPKRKYSSVSDATRVSMVQLALRDPPLTPSAIAVALGVSVKSVHNRLRDWRLCAPLLKKHKGGRVESRAIPEVVEQRVCALQREHNEWTQQQIIDQLKRERDDVDASEDTPLDLMAALMHHLPAQQTVSDILRRRGFSEKRLTIECEAKNEERVKDLRFDYHAAYSALHTAQNTIFFDETAWSSTTTRHRGRSEIGVPAVKKADVVKGVHISVVAAFTPERGIIAWKSFEGTSEEGRGVNMETFTQFVEEVAIATVRDLPGREYYFIYDNASIHSKPALKAMLKKYSPNFHSCFLPPYSPRLNPIEQVFSQWKARARSSTIRNKQHVYDFITGDAGRCTPEQAFHYFEEVQQNAYLTCLNREDMK
jgi:hypothetical protein